MTLAIQAYAHELERHRLKLRLTLNDLAPRMVLPREVSTFAPEGWALMFSWPGSVMGYVASLTARIEQGQASCIDLPAIQRALTQYQAELSPVLKRLRAELQRLPAPTLLTALASKVPRDRDTQALFATAVEGLNAMAPKLQSLITRLEIVSAQLTHCIEQFRHAVLCPLLQLRALVLDALKGLAETLR